MNHYGQEGVSGVSGHVDVLARLVADNVAMEPIDPGRQLLRGLPAPWPMEEFYSEADMARVVALPAGGEDGRTHGALAERGLPVLRPVREVNGVLLLRVPPGTRPLGAVLHQIAADVHQFGVALAMAGEIQGQLLARDFGGLQPAHGQRVVDRLAVAPMDEAGQAAQVLLVPPYYLGEPGQATPADFGERIWHELAATGLFDEYGADYLARQAAEGVRRVYHG